MVVRYAYLMIQSNDFEILGAQLVKLLPPGMETLKDGLSENLKAVLQNWLADLDLVTREEFDAQTAVLARTRAKLDALEKQLQSIESADST